MQWSSNSDQTKGSLDKAGGKTVSGPFDIFTGLSLAKSLFQAGRPDARPAILVASASNFLPSYESLQAIKEGMRARTAFVKVLVFIFRFVCRRLTACDWC